MNGIEMSKKIKAMNPEQTIVIISAYTETEFFMDAIHMGISDYIIKPIEYEQMNSVLYKLANNIQARKENKLFHENLYKLVAEQTQSITDNYELTIKAMVDVVESRDSYTGGHSERVARFCEAIAQEMMLSEEECALIFRAGMLHDIGKVTTPDAILMKPGKLSEREHDLIKNHVVVSYEMLAKIPMYQKLSLIVQSHHERYDGKGYPNGLKGDEIPLLARIMIIADAFDAMTTNRIYKGRKSREAAIAEIEAGSGTQFCPEIVPYACKALSTVTINESITQLPHNSMEAERFAYFFHDSVTENYNSEYLILYLKTINKEIQHCANVIYLRNFSQYNKKYGWEQGNALLKSTADYLANKYPYGVLFRIYGDDFVLISKDKFHECPEEEKEPFFLKNTGVTMEYHHLLVTDKLTEEIKYLEGHDSEASECIELG